MFGGGKFKMSLGDLLLYDPHVNLVYKQFEAYEHNGKQHFVLVSDSIIMITGFENVTINSGSSFAQDYPMICAQIISSPQPSYIMKTIRFRQTYFYAQHLAFKKISSPA